MMRMALLAAVLLGVAAPAVAADVLSYDDPGMHFKAPEGWTRVELGDAGGASASQAGGERPPAAVFLWHAGRSEQRSIVIDIQSFAGTLQGFETQHESELRSGAESTFVDKKTLTALGNGMPAYFLRISQGSDVGKFIRRYDYMVFDGSRSIDVSYTGRQGDFDEKEVLEALSSLYVVQYPGDRR